MFFSFIPSSSCPPASSPLSKNNYQLERMKASKCFFQYSWSQPAVSLRILLFMSQGSIIHSWGSASALFQIPKLADTHYWLVLLRLRWEKEYFLLPRKSLPQIALPILFPWLWWLWCWELKLQSPDNRAKAFLLHHMTALKYSLKKVMQYA